MDSIEGMKCPECGYTESFEIEIGVFCTVDAEDNMMDAGEFGDWDHGSRAKCPILKCCFEGTVADFLDAQAETEPGQHTPGDTWTYEVGNRGGHIMPDNVFSSPLTIHHQWSEVAPEGASAAANMKHAVLAVNCHDDLLAACRAMVKVYDDIRCGKECSAPECDICAAHKVACAAIANAERPPAC